MWLKVIEILCVSRHKYSVLVDLSDNDNVKKRDKQTDRQTGESRFSCLFFSETGHILKLLMFA